MSHLAEAGNWPYPTWIAHRGAGKLAPENTLAAFKLGASYGFRMFECDIKLSTDGVPFLLHDALLDRTSNGHGIAGDHNWEALSKLDAGTWRAPEFSGEPIPTLERIARYCLDNGYYLNIEIKPTPGAEALTGFVVANESAKLWANAEVPPLLTSFQPASLAAALKVQPQLPRGLLIDNFEELPMDWLEMARQLKCVAIVCNHRLWNATTVSDAKNAGFRTLSYTVNDEAIANHLLALGTDGVITDRVDFFKP